MRYDILIKGGHVVDPASGIDDPRDVAVVGDKIAAIGIDLDPDSSASMIDATGRLVTPGLVDLHTHIFRGATFWGVDHMARAWNSGVTTWIDAGSAGAYTITAFDELVARPSEVGVYALLNISSIGLAARTGELAVSRYCDPYLCSSTAAVHRDRVVGLKARLSGPIVGDNWRVALDAARRAADDSGLPLMVHIGDSPPTLDDVVRILRSGDIVTHCATPKSMQLVDARGRPLDVVRSAVDRGVVLDVGHGSGSFSFRVAEALIGNGLFPDVISSDLHQLSARQPRFDLAACLSKYLALGMPLREVVAAATCRPAAAVGLQDRAGCLGVGRQADIAIFDTVRGRFEMSDVEMNTRVVELMLRNVVTISRGKVLGERATPPPAPWIEPEAAGRPMDW